MNTTKITVSAALREKNIIDRKLSRGGILEELKFVDLRRKGVDKTLEGVSVADAEKSVQSAFDKVEALVHNRYAYDKAIKQSNATTKIEVAGKEYTVAEAIEYIKSHELALNVYAAMKKQYETAKKKLMHEDASIDQNVQSQKTAILGAGDSNPAAITKIIESIDATEDLKRLQYIDPCNVEKTFTEMKENLDKFKLEVNDKINTSNATTEIEVELK